MKMKNLSKPLERIPDFLKPTLGLPHHTRSDIIERTAKAVLAIILVDQFNRGEIKNLGSNLWKDSRKKTGGNKNEGN
jgi:hypothetical protein